MQIYLLSHIITQDKSIVPLHFIYPNIVKEVFILSYRIEYIANAVGSTVIEYADAQRQAELTHEAETGTISILNEYRFESYADLSA